MSLSEVHVHVLSLLYQWSIKGAVRGRAVGAGCGSRGSGQEKGECFLAHPSLRPVCSCRCPRVPFTSWVRDQGEPTSYLGSFRASWSEITLAILEEHVHSLRFLSWGARGMCHFGASKAGWSEIAPAILGEACMFPSLPKSGRKGNMAFGVVVAAAGAHTVPSLWWHHDVMQRACGEEKPRYASLYQAKEGKISLPLLEYLAINYCSTWEQIGTETTAWFQSVFPNYGLKWILFPEFDYNMELSSRPETITVVIWPFHHQF